MGNLWTVDARLEIPGVIMELCHADWPDAVVIESTNVEHILGFTLSPMPDLIECSISDPASDTPPIGYLALWPANTPYRTLTGGGHHRFFQFRMDPKRFEALTGLGSGWDPQTGMNITGTAIDGFLMRLAREAAEPGFASRVLVEGLAMAVMADLARYLRNTRTETSGAGKLTSTQLHRLEHYIETHEGSSPTVAMLADLIGVSRRHLTRVFKQTTGQTIHEYVANVRIRKASTLLCGTDLPLKEISHRLGFAGLASFSAAFRSATGQSPTSFRRNLRNPASSAAA